MDSFRVGRFHRRTRKYLDFRSHTGISIDDRRPSKEIIDPLQTIHEYPWDSASSSFNPPPGSEATDYYPPALPLHQEIEGSLQVKRVNDIWLVFMTNLLDIDYHGSPCTPRSGYPASKLQY